MAVLPAHIPRGRFDELNAFSPINYIMSINLCNDWKYEKTRIIQSDIQQGAACKLQLTCFTCSLSHFITVVLHNLTVSSTSRARIQISICCFLSPSTAKRAASSCCYSFSHSKCYFEHVRDKLMPNCFFCSLSERFRNKHNWLSSRPNTDHRGGVIQTALRAQQGLGAASA